MFFVVFLFQVFGFWKFFCYQELSDDNMAAALRAAQEKMDGKAQGGNDGAMAREVTAYVDECRELF